MAPFPLVPSARVSRLSERRSGWYNLGVRLSPPLLLEANGVRFRFGEAPEVLRGVALQVHSGEILALIGPGGAGKSVLMKALGGLLVPTAGEVRYAGEPLGAWLTPHREKAFRREVGMSFQSGGLFDSWTAGENLVFAARELLGLGDRQAEALARTALGDVGLERAFDKPIAALSGGMQRRLGVARALLSGPKLVLLDDPTAGLDPVTARAITGLIKDVASRRRTAVVLATTDVARAFEIGDRVAFLWEGQALACARPDELRTSRERPLYQFLRGLPAEERSA